ncbi:hypothetical protein HaLaN_27039 [Haematococcus lacustris]|uniref:Uncharacterized protein n=1 Tax=Haematococcus lacustris TaxID=44745 RepID=A0A6A0A7Q7_HAELA|nr:hypothetical protein HaLaN_27039 [Haematococcus lacustris]
MQGWKDLQAHSKIMQTRFKAALCQEAPRHLGAHGGGKGHRKPLRPRQVTSQEWLRNPKQGSNGCPCVQPGSAACTRCCGACSRTSRLSPTQWCCVGWTPMTPWWEKKKNWLVELMVPVAQLLTAIQADHANLDDVHYGSAIADKWFGDATR